MNSFFLLFYKTIQIAENESSNDISLLKNLMKEIILWSNLLCLFHSDNIQYSLKLFPTSLSLTWFRVFDGKLCVGEMLVRVPTNPRDTTLNWESGQSEFLSYQLSQILKQNKQMDCVTIWYTILSLQSCFWHFVGLIKIRYMLLFMVCCM